MSNRNKNRNRNRNRNKNRRNQNARAQTQAQTKTKKNRDYELNTNEPKRPQYTKQADVIDYLSEDDQVSGQKYVAVSYATICETQKDEIVNEIVNKRHHPERVVREIVDEWTRLEHPKRAVKIRGSRGDYQEILRRAECVRNFDENFHVFIGEVGKWLPFDPNPELIEDENFMEQQLNNLVKGYKLNKLKTKTHFEQRKREMMEQAIMEGTPEGQQAMMEADEPIEAVEYAVNACDETIKEFQEKINTIERRRELAHQKLVYMKEQVKNGKVYPKLEDVIKEKMGQAQKMEQPRIEELPSSDNYTDLGGATESATESVAVSESFEVNNPGMLEKLRTVEESRTVPENLSHAVAKLNQAKPELMDQYRDAASELASKDDVQNEKQESTQEPTHTDETITKVFGGDNILPHEQRELITEFDNERIKEV